MQTPHVLACGHKFHMQCITSWFEIKNTCPICRDTGDRENDEEDDGMEVRDDELMERFFSNIESMTDYKIPLPDNGMEIEQFHRGGVSRIIVRDIDSTQPRETSAYRDRVLRLFMDEYGEIIRNALAIHGILLLLCTFLEYRHYFY